MPTGRLFLSSCAILSLLCTQPQILVAAPGAFFEQHCTKCHGAEKQKGDLRLDNLGAPTTKGENGEVWRAVLDRLESGDMPPKKEPRPEPAALAKTIDQIADELAKTAERPISLRRLNRFEYEHTIHDLLGIDTPLVDLLPEDSRVQGFDNVADGLSISSILMERYLEAADVAFDGTIRRIPPLPAATRRSVILEGKENIDSVKKNKGGVIEVEGAFVKFTPGWPPVRIDEAHPIEDGRYRVRLAVWPHDPGERTLALAAYVGPLFGSGKRRFQGMFDVCARTCLNTQRSKCLAKDFRLRKATQVFPGLVDSKDMKWFCSIV